MRSIFEDFPDNPSGRIRHNLRAGISLELQPDPWKATYPCEWLLQEGLFWPILTLLVLSLSSSFSIRWVSNPHRRTATGSYKSKKFPLNILFNSNYFEQPVFSTWKIEMSLLEAVLSNFPVLSLRDPTQSVCVAAPVVAVRSPVHLCSLASCYNIDNIEDFQTFKINMNLRVHVVTIGSPKRPSW